MLLGGAGHNTGLPLTDNQKNRNAQMKESDKKRAAAAKAAAASQRPPTSAPDGSSGGEAAPPLAARLSSTTSTWAPPCKFWAKGECHSGINCLFKHAGIPTEAGRCFICGSKDHRQGECPRPGGGADPQKKENWAEYTKRREANGGGKGDKGKGKGGGKLKGKGRTGTKEEEQDRREEQLQPQAVLPLMLRPLERAGTLLLPQGSITVPDSPGRGLHWTHGPTSG